MLAVSKTSLSRETCDSSSIASGVSLPLDLKAFLEEVPGLGGNPVKDIHRRLLGLPPITIPNRAAPDSRVPSIGIFCLTQAVYDFSHAILAIVPRSFLFITIPESGP
jgi:hypothetical protein